MNEKIKTIKSKVCIRCKITHDTAKQDSWCPACRSAYGKEWAQANPVKRRDGHRRQRYGISPDIYLAKVAKQNGLCIICNKPPRPNKQLAVDHDHACCAGAKSCGNCLRGLLCDSCNLGLGSFKDNRQLLLNAAKYLKTHEKNNL